MKLYELGLGTAAALVVSVTASYAITTSASATYNIIESGFSDSASDSQTDAGSSAAVGTPGSLSGTSNGVSASINANGASVLSAGGGFADGNQGHNGTATTVYTQSLTNNSGGVQEYTIDYFLPEMSIYLNGDFGGASNEGNPFPALSNGSVGGFISYELTLNGSSVLNANIEAFGGSDSYATENVAGFTFAALPQNCGTFGCSGIIFDLDNFSGTLDLGQVADGDTITVAATLSTGFYANGFENDVVVSAGDPLNPAGTGLVTAKTNGGGGTGGGTGGGGPTVIPVPAGFVLLGTALLGLGALRRRN